MLTMGIRDRIIIIIIIIPVLHMTTVAPSGSIIGLRPVYIERDSQHLHQLRNGTRFYYYIILLQNTNDAPTIHIVPPCLVRLLCRESPITGSNIYNIGHKIPVHWIYVLKHRMPLTKGPCTDVWLYISNQRPPDL